MGRLWWCFSWNAKVRSVSTVSIFLFFYFSLLKISPYLFISCWGGAVWWGVMDGLYVDSQDID